MKLSNIRLLVTDFDRCYTFYKDILGLECSWGKIGENYASFNIGIPSGLALFKADLMNKAINNSETGTKNAILDKAAIILQVEDVDETYNLLTGKGVTFLTAPKDMSDWGIRVAHFRDPENNLIELFSELN